MVSKFVSLGLAVQILPAGKGGKGASGGRTVPVECPSHNKISSRDGATTRSSGTGGGDELLLDQASVVTHLCRA